jgi:hypothetical protein
MSLAEYSQGLPPENMAIQTVFDVIRRGQEEEIRELVAVGEGQQFGSNVMISAAARLHDMMVGVEVWSRLT